MVERLPRDAPNARRIGLVYLSYFLLAFAAAIVTKGLIVSGDPPATASSILAHESRYRAGIAIDLLANVVYIAVTALFYRLFAPVNRTASLLAAFVSLTGCAIQIGGGLLRLAPLVILRDSPLSTVFNRGQLQALAFLSLKLYAQTFSVSLVVFAFYDLLLGYLILESTFLPRTLGLLLILAGIGWLAFVWPPVATALSPYVMLLGALAEVVLMVWLLGRGVDASTSRDGDAA
jgi:hypothetical protein